MAIFAHFDCLLCYQFIDTFVDSHYYHDITGIVSVTNVISICVVNV